MEEKTLFEIPVYSMQEESFLERWEKHKNKFYLFFMNCNNTAEYARTIYEKLYYPRYLWHFNQIAAYITIIVFGYEVEVRLYMGIRDKIRFDSVNKNFIKNECVNGLHFYAENMCDDEIKEELEEMLQIVREMIPRRFYVDDSAYKNIIQHVNLKGILCDIATIGDIYQ